MRLRIIVQVRRFGIFGMPPAVDCYFTMMRSVTVTAMPTAENNKILCMSLYGLHAHALYESLCTRYKRGRMRALGLGPITHGLKHATRCVLRKIITHQ
jgi:hypothetical protein